MLGKVAEEDQSLLKTVDLMAVNNGYQFERDRRHRWRFHYDGDAVDTQVEQNGLFYKEGNGKKGSWSPELKEYAKKWAAAISTVWEDEKAQEVQVVYTSRRLMGFALPYARTVLDTIPQDDMGYAFRAAYLSFAANNPTWANKHLKRIIGDTSTTPWTQDWLIEILKELTFGPKITIYPHRYNAIRPVLEKLYGLELPDFSKELKTWKEGQPHSLFYDTQEVQQALITIGLDLGPWGADGKWGDKTTEATLTFEQMDYGEPDELKVPPEHVDGVMDDYTAKKLEWVLERRGIEHLTETTSQD
jgi:hypothetical protein